MKASSRLAREPVPSSEQDQEQGKDPFLYAICAGMIVVLWVLPLASSLWLDELGTYWAVEGSLAETVERAASTHGQSPAYYVIAWAMRIAGGGSEVVLRLPSLLAMLAVLPLVHRLVMRLSSNRIAADVSVFLVIVSKPLAFAAADARPYALGLLGIVASSLLLVRWVDERRARDAVGYVLAVTFVFYIHFLLVVAMLAHVLFLVARAKDLRGRKGQVGGIVAGTVALVLPGVPQVLSLFERREVLSTAETVSISKFFGVVLATDMIGSALIGLAIASVYATIRVRGGSWRAGSLPLIVFLALAAPVTLFFVTALTEAKMFADRYILSAFLGIAIAGGAAIGFLRPRRAVRIVVASVAAVSLLAAAPSATMHSPEDWRGAAAVVAGLDVAPDTPLLVHAAFVEALNIDWLDDPAKLRYLNAPLTRYPMPGKQFVVPFLDNERGTAYIVDLVERELVGHDRFVYVTRRPWVPLHKVIEERVAPRGYVKESIKVPPTIEVFVFSRTSIGGTP